MSRALVVFIETISVVALCGPIALWAQDTPAPVKDPISPADCLKDKKKAPDCQRLGVLYANGQSVPQDEPRAVEFLDAACRAGLIGSCGAQGWLLLKLHQRPDDVKRGEQLLDRACREGVLTACDVLGRTYANGVGVARDVPKAAKLLDKACESNFTRSCLALADLLDAGEGIARDPERAKALTTKACTFGSTEACERACKAGDGVRCVTWGERLNESGSADASAVDDAYKLACDAGTAQGCARRARRTKDDAQVVALLDRACSLGDILACADAARFYYHGRGVAKDLAVAMRLYAVACEKQIRDACIALGGVYARGERGAEEQAKGKEYFVKACGVDAACLAIVANGNVPSKWGGSLEALRPSEQGPVLAGAVIKEPKKIRNVNPRYPPEARAARIQGTVTLKCVISAEGNVTDVQVVSGPTELVRSAVECVRQWRYTPTLLDGRPVPVNMTVTVNFTIS